MYLNAFDIRNDKGSTQNCSIDFASQNVHLKARKQEDSSKTG